MADRARPAQFDAMGLTELLADQHFSGVVLVKGPDRTVFESATGLASRRWGIRNTLDTRFDTAAITKLFTSVAVMQQVDAGTLDLETSIHHYVDLADTTIAPTVTLLHLLTHTSGIADDVDEDAGESYDDLWRSVPVSSLRQTADYLPLFAHKPAIDEPGLASAYSNAGYILAGLALERATGMPYRQYVAERVFAPAGMCDSGFFDRREAVDRMAEGWDPADGAWTQNLFGSPPIGAPHEGAYSTAGDLVLFLRSLRDGHLLSPELTDEFFTPQVDHDQDTRFGFGLEFDVHEDGAVRSFYADGINPGASGILRHYVAERLDVVVLSNSQEGAWAVIRDLDERLGG